MSHWVATLGRRLAALGSMLVLLTACGGGGGGGGFLSDDGTGNNPLTITTGTLPDVASTPYSTVLEASGGTPPYSWELIDDGGTGFTINSEGIFRGDALPPAGTYGVTISVSDANGRDTRQSFTLTVTTENALSIATTALPQAIEGLDYTALLDASGGAEPYRWSVVNDGGTGFGINADGVLTGTAPDSGDYGITLEVTDEADSRDRQSFILTVTGDTPQPLTIATETLPTAEEGQTYSAILQAAGGQGDYLWTLVDAGGTGLDLRDDGVLSGTVPAEGSYGITVAVADNVREVSKSLVLTVSAEGDPLTLGTTSLPGATVGERYAAVLEATGGSRDYSWQLVSSGDSGLSLSSAGVLSGTPSAVGTYGIVFRVSDGQDTVQGALTLVVDTFEPFVPLAVVTETLPAANGQIYAATLEAEGGTPPYSWTLVNDGGSGLSLSTSGSLSGTSPAVGTYGLTVSVADSAGGSDTAALTLEVDGSDATTLEIISTDLGTATQGETYSFILRASGGPTGDYTWSKVEVVPSLPTIEIGSDSFEDARLTLDPDTGVLTWFSGDIENGVLTGECTTDYSYTVQVTDAGPPASSDVRTLPLTAALDPNDPDCQ
ncbi:putative Ig domain-containing protein [Pseudohaliea rubra]|uniref:Uncharacterized protein n=1 Tax=Pseudohaliea rubra DSM 19751 TaxID=1265313 RepID=A0A095VN48_9GAMM|nr:putative Ig domain-containing protein [Pseudohaliea rubra]KGE02805.1 hypothetical protein HRUBRA_02618 [Pseudohaliea rubra DSM 19751]